MLAIGDAWTLSSSEDSNNMLTRPSGRFSTAAQLVDPGGKAGSTGPRHSPAAAKDKVSGATHTYLHTSIVTASVTLLYFCNLWAAAGCVGEHPRGEQRNAGLGILVRQRRRAGDNGGAHTSRRLHRHVRPALP